MTSRNRGVHPAWRAFGGRLLAIAALSTLVGVVVGLTAGLLVAVLLLVWVMGLRTRDLVCLARWIEGRDERDFPQAGGAWGQVFLALSRRLRWEAKEIALTQGEAAAFREAMAALPDGVVLLNGLSQITWANPAAEQHLGFRLAQDIGRVITHLVRIPGFAEYLNRADPDEPFTFTSGRDGSLILGLELVSVGNGRHLLVTFDITDLHRAEAMRRDFVANVSHELRTPLTVIHGFLEHLAEGNLGEEERRQFVSLMQDQSSRMLRLVDDLLTLSRLEGERQPRRDEVVDVRALTDRLLAEAEGLSRGRHVLAHQLDALDLRGDPDELRSALGNLLSNAVRYTPAGGQITVRWQVSEIGGQLSVSDTGIGIPAEAIPRLTERFFRVDKGRSRDTGGTGLGLAIVKHVLIRHQAELQVQSTPGEGSTFTVRFPVSRLVAPRHD